MPLLPHTGMVKRDMQTHQPCILPGHLETLGEISRVLTATLDPDELYEAVYQQVARVMEVSHFFVALCDPERGVLGIPYLRDGGNLIRHQIIPAQSTLTGWVVRHGEVLQFGSDAEYRAFASARDLPAVVIGDAGSEAKVFVPLTTGRETLGALSVQSTHRDAYTADDVRVLAIIAAQAAVAIRNAELFAQQRRRMEEMETLSEIVRELTPLHDVDRIFEVVCRRLRTLIPHDACHVYVLPRGARRLQAVGDADLEREGVGEGIVRWISSHARSVSIPNTATDDRCAGSEPARQVPSSLLGAPLIADGQVRGVICLTARGIDAYPPDVLRLLEVVAGQAGIVLDRAWLYHDLQTQAVTDSLTRVYNRRFLVDSLQEEIQRARHNNYSVGAVMIDVDGFKQINDTLGHAAGDRVLCEIAAVIRSGVRAEDIVARYGGEEFCVLLPHIGWDDVRAVAERIRSLVEGHMWDEGLARVTVSVGATVLTDGTGDTDILRAADDAMYAAKRAGGNRVRVVEVERVPVT